MVLGLERRQAEGDLHFVTFSCYHRLPYLDTPLLRDLFEDALQKARRRYRFDVIGYVVMPEHVHLLLSEPGKDLLAAALQALKLSVVRRTMRRTFWQARYYDFNVFTEAKRIEKLSYMHWNPVKRGLVEKPEDWLWSSCRYYQTGQEGRVTIDSSWRRQ
jgi:putative transposase